MSIIGVGARWEGVLISDIFEEAIGYVFKEIILPGIVWILFIPIALVLATPVILIISIWGDDTYSENIINNYQGVVSFMTGWY
ncbi:MAG: hypothetical protein GY841_00350 [FCB group bacterium]|nr:hypothetical protein [FCB group bacterium]